MTASMASLVFCGLVLGQAKTKPYEPGFVCQPAYEIDEVVRGPMKAYVPQPGDIFLSTDRSRVIQAGHRLALSGQPNHSGIVITRPDGRPAILEGGPFNGLRVEIVDLRYDMQTHEERGEKVWIRQRKTPLTKDQSDQLTAFAIGQDGKRFAAGRMMAQLTVFRTRGPLRTYVMGTPNGERDSYFCSELVTESLVHVGALSAETTRPSATYPRDLFFNTSSNLYLNRYFTMADGWLPPSRWFTEATFDAKSAPSTIRP
jgi:hypothetical protein